MIKPLFTFIVYLVLVFFIGLNVLVAQETVGSISGKVGKENSAASGAKVILKFSSAKKMNRFDTKTTTVDASGRFSFTGIRFGTYNLIVEYSCMVSERNEIEVNSSEVVEIQIAIPSEDCEKKASDEAAKWKVCDENAPKLDLDFSDSDKNEIFREILHDADEHFEIPDYETLVNQHLGIVLLAENANQDWLKLIPNLRITTLDYPEIKLMARKRKEDILVLSFSATRIGSCVKANIATSWVIGKKSKRIYLSGGSCSYNFRKESGKWIGKQEICSIS